MTERSIFLDALDIPNPADRADFLDRKCSPDADLRRRVDALLAAHAVAGEFLEPPSPVPTVVRPPGVPGFPNIQIGSGVEATVTAPGSASRESLTGAAVGDIIAGKYRLLERLGEGGMGEVWLTEQSVPVRRKVALKLIKPGMDSQQVLARFEAERQALAMMDHPNIAKVLDAGATADGHPYFVLELVKGLPITEFCDARRLTPQQRLELFIPVCQAIQHAHQKGIIHRDIKPSNVLVALYDDKPAPKMIDFGVAKATGQPLTENTIHTAFQAVVGTLPYMSPEQATFNQLDIDTRSDVYSLGVLLYELLTGTTPVEKARFVGAEWLEKLRLVREEEPPRPSARLSTAESRASIAATRGTEPAKLSKLLRGELDWIVMKSLEKDRTRRYDTATNLAQDVERYLADEMVEARPPSLGYRAQKFLRKNRRPVVAVGLVLVALVAGITGTTIGLLRADEARQDSEKKEGYATKSAEDARQAKEREAGQRVRAEKAQDRTHKVLRFMSSEITGAARVSQKTITPELKTFLIELLTHYKDFAGEKEDDESSRFQIAIDMLRLGLIESRLGLKEESATTFRRARESVSAMAAEFPTGEKYYMSLALCHECLAVPLHELGKLAEEVEECHKALNIRMKLAAEFPAVPEYRSDLALSYSTLGAQLIALGNRSEAMEHYSQALAIREKLATDFPAIPVYRSGLAETYQNLALLLSGREKWEEAASEYSKALAIWEKLATEFPTAPEYRASLALCVFDMGTLFISLRKQSEAEQEYRKALAIREKLSTEFPTVPEYRAGLSWSHFNLGNLLSDFGKGTEAEGQYRKALAIQEKLAADFPTVPEHRACLASSYFRVGYLLNELEKWAEAEEQYRKALAVNDKLAADFPTVPEHRENLASTHNNLGGVLIYDRVKKAEAEEQYHKALAIRKKLVADFPSVPKYHANLAISHHNLGILLANLGKWAEGEEHFHQTLAIREKLAANFPDAPELLPEIAKSLYNFACFYAVRSSQVEEKKREHADRAMELLQKAVKAGFKDTEQMTKDTNLNQLRDRADFKKLLESLPKPKPKE